MAEITSPLILYSLMVGMLLTGTLNTIILKMQNLQTYYNEDKDKQMVYNHPFFQTFNMFIGELCCLAVYAFTYYRENKKYGNINASPQMIEAKKKGLKTNINVLLLAIPACFDICASTLMFTALTMIPASIYQMMRGLIVFVAAMMSIIFLKRRFHRHHWAALIFVVGGVGIVGASPILYPEDEEGDESVGSPVFGIILLIIAQLFAGGLMISEEKLLGNYYLHPLKVVGWEGFWGCFIYIILLFIMQFIKCTDPDICPYGSVEDTPQAFYEMGQNAWIWVLALGVIVSIACFNGLGVAVTKYANAAQRSTIDTSRTLLVWGFFLFKPGDAGKERFIWLELVGFVMLVAGTLVFNEIVVIPICGFDKNTKSAKEKAKLNAVDEDVDPSGLISKDTSIDSAQGYMPTSPAHYDYQRNYKNVKKHMQNKTIETEEKDMRIAGTE